MESVRESLLGHNNISCLSFCLRITFQPLKMRAPKLSESASRKSVPACRLPDKDKLEFLFVQQPTDAFALRGRWEHCERESREGACWVELIRHNNISRCFFCASLFVVASGYRRLASAEPKKGSVCSITRAINSLARPGEVPQRTQPAGPLCPLLRNERQCENEAGIAAITGMPCRDAVLLKGKGAEGDCLATAPTVIMRQGKIRCFSSSRLISIVQKKANA